MPYSNTHSSPQRNAVFPGALKEIVICPTLRVLINRSELQKFPNLHILVLDLQTETPFWRKVAERCWNAGGLKSWLAKQLQNDIYLCEFTQFRVWPLCYKTRDAESWSLELVYENQNTNVLIHSLWNVCKWTAIHFIWPKCSLPAEKIIWELK